VEQLNNLQQVDQSSSQVEETPNQDSQQDTTQKDEHSDAEKNFAALRSAREKAERERDEYLHKLKQYEEQQKRSQEPPKQEIYRDPSDLAEYKDLLELRKEMAAQKQNYDQQATEIKLRQSFPDIDEVLSAKNIAKFREQEPELAQMLNDNKNLYSKASVAYKYIKKMGVVDQDLYKKEKEAIAINASKPRPSDSISKGSPLSQMNDFTESTAESRARIYKEMVSAINSG